MRLHRNLVFTVIDSMKLIFNEGEYADKVVEKALKRDKKINIRFIKPFDLKKKVTIFARIKGIII